MKTRPVDARGYPVPWFVEWIDGKPEFRVMDSRKWTWAVRDKLCWVCGQPLGVYKVFVIGPMCGINRTTQEPPCHLDCAEWSARNCPFLSRPHMTRREDELTKALEGNVRGIPIQRNPGVALVWVTRTYSLKGDGRGNQLIHLGDPERTVWYAEGRRATRAEVIASIESGFPALLETAELEDKIFPKRQAVRELQKYKAAFEHFYPAS